MPPHVRVKQLLNIEIGGVLLGNLGHVEEEGEKEVGKAGHHWPEEHEELFLGGAVESPVQQHEKAEPQN